MNDNIIYTPSEKISFKKSSQFSEKWLQDRIAEDPVFQCYLFNES